MNGKKLKIDLISMVVCVILAVIAHLLTISNQNSNLIVSVWLLSFIIGIRSKAIAGYQATITTKHLNVEFLMILSALGAFVLKDYYEAIVLIIIFGFSGVLEEYSMTKSEKSLSSLLEITPETAIKISDHQQMEVNVKDLFVGDLILVRVGDLVAADGIIISGNTTLNQAAVTGEFIGVDKGVGDQVLSGTINVLAPITVQITTNPSESTAAKIVAFVQQAQNSKTKSDTAIERFEKYYVYVILISSFLLMTIPFLLQWVSFEQAFYRAIVLLVVASPCALVASITPVMLSTLASASHQGILIKGAQPIEQLNRVQVVLMDKTGTITKGEPQVVAIEYDDTIDKIKLNQILLAAETKSNHPLAHAIVNYFKQHNDLTTSSIAVKITEVAGLGLQVRVEQEATIYQIGKPTFNDSKLSIRMKRDQNFGFTIVAIYQDNNLVGYVKCMDTLRDDAATMVSDLKNLKLQPVLLSGDSSVSAQMIGRLVQFDTVVGDCLPEDKVSVLQKYQATNQVVAMVGDGINDSPVLANSDVSIAMGNGSSIALETADIVLMNEKLSNLPLLFKLARKAMRITTFNIIFSLTIIVGLICLNLFQILSLPIGVVFHEGSTIVVILNGLRMLKIKH